MVRDAGLEITLFQPFRDFEGMPEPHRTRAFDRAERKFDLMQELGTELMLVCSNVSSVALGGIDRAAEDFAELGARAPRRGGLRVGYEALAWGRHVNDPPRCLGDRAKGRSRQRRTHSRQLPYAGAQDRREHDPLDPGRPHFSRATRRRAPDRHGPALLEPAFPQHAGRRGTLPSPTSCGRWPRPAMTARCRWRSSTTSSGAGRRNPSPSTGTGRWST